MDGEYLVDDAKEFLLRFLGAGLRGDRPKFGCTDSSNLRSRIRSPWIAFNGDTVKQHCY